MTTTTTTATTAVHATRGGDRISGRSGQGLRRTGFGRLWASSGASNLGDGILLVGLPVLATTVTTSPMLISGVTVAVLLPSALSALPAGAFADRLDRRRLLIGANAVRCVGLAAVLALVLAGELTLAAIYLAAVICGSTELFADTTAQAAVPSLVGGDGLEQANARMIGTQVVANNAVGGPVGAALATAGGGALIGSSVLLYLAAGIAAVTLRLPSVRRDPVERRRWDRQLRSEIGEGLHHLRRDQVLLRIAITGCLMNVGGTAFSAIAVLYVLGPLGLPAVAFGWLAAALAVGAVVASLVAARVVDHVGRAATLRSAFVVGIVSYGLLAAAPHPAVVYPAVTVLGAAGLLTNVASRSIRQTRTPDRLLGRVTASTMALAIAATPVGALLGGVIAEVVDERATAAFAAGVSFLALLLLRSVTRARVDVPNGGAASEDGVAARTSDVRDLDDPGHTPSP